MSDQLPISQPEPPGNFVLCSADRSGHDWQDGDYCLLQVWNRYPATVDAIPVQVCSRCSMVRIKPKETA